MQITMIDPPEGWRYGFPKPIPKEHQNRVLEWLVEQGYPQRRINELGKSFYSRYWVEHSPVEEE
jgi:hypothetical protein